MSYFQQGQVTADDLKAAKMMDITCQFLDEPTFNQLRTIEQLGYVVFTRPNLTRDVHALQFCVQSPQKCCSHIRNSLDSHLKTMAQKAKDMSDSEFETMIKSVLVEIEAKDKNLREIHSRLFAQEIGNHRYQFDRQVKEAATLREITKQEWQAHFDALVSTQVRRVDFRYNSEAHKEQEQNGEYSFPNE